MSTDLKPVAGRIVAGKTGKVMLTQFHGGDIDGMCLQLTGPMNGYIQLTNTQAYDLALALLHWVKYDWPEENEND
jgi:hypothetical protein